MDFNEADRKRSYRLNTLIGLIGSAFLVGFGVNALIDDEFVLAASLILAATLGLGSLWLMWRTGDLRYGTYGVSLAASYVFLYLIVSGGAGGTGPLWCYPLVALITFLQGLRRGILVVTGLTVVTVILLFTPDLPFAVAEYSSEFKIRFIASFLALALMALIYEHLRAESQSRYRSISNRLDKAARTDDLTGLANRREMSGLLEVEYARFIRHGLPFSVIMLDLDRFKQLNDRFGHATGDRMLVRVASLLTANTRLTDRVARWGGEEFLILLSQTNLAQAAEVAEKLRFAIAGSGDNTHQESITASLGVQCIEDAGTTENLINQADNRLYEAKNSGRNRVVAEYPGRVEANTA